MADKKNDKHTTKDSSVQKDSPESSENTPNLNTDEAVISAPETEHITDAETVQDNVSDKTDSLQGEFFATDTPEQSQTESGDSNAKPKKSLWSYVVMGLIVLALLLCGYIFNIFGLRSANNTITFMTDSAVSGAKLDHKSDIKPAVPDVKSGDIKQITPVQNSVTDVKKTDAEQKTQPKTVAVLSAELQKKQNPDAVDVKNNNVTTPAPLVQAENIADKIETGKTETGKTEFYATNRTDYLKYRQSIKDLNQKIYAKQSYINELIAVKSIFPNVDLTVMTRYALTGTVDKFTLAKRGVRAVHRAAMLKESLPNDATLYDKAGNIFKRLVVITADKNDTNQISGQLGLIKNAFQSGDFDMAQSLIDDLPPSHKTIFFDVMMSYADMRGLKSEMRVLDDALVDKLFATE